MDAEPDGGSTATDEAPELPFIGRVHQRIRRTVIDYGVFLLFATFALIGIWLLLNRDAGYVQTLLSRYWLLALFAVFILEGAMLLYFAPSETLVPAAIGLASTTDIAPGTMTVYLAIIGISVVGATIGQYILFLLAKRWGRERLLAKPWFRIKESYLDKFDRWFARWGRLAIPISNSLLLTRGMLTVPAGFAEMRDRDFILLSALGTIIFESLLAAGTLGVLSLVDLPILVLG